jgi:1-deoxy-D-xylulose-5-phosphate reductoisomerase
VKSMSMKRIAILGSTGSIGQNTLKVIEGFPDRFKVVALTTQTHIDLLCQQAEKFCPEYICVTDESASLKIKPKISSKIKLFEGESGLEELCTQKRIDKIVVAVSGASALLPLLKAIECHKEIALANKEALVMAGAIIMRQASEHNLKIIPIDSEQSAIWQCLEGQDTKKLQTIYLTASGGPFREFSRKQLERISVKQALSHPRWRMGKKISVDSATLMNKGLEVLEAMHLFAASPDKIKVLIHPESIIHSMVEFIDGVIMAQLSITDMRIPIQYAVMYPERMKTSLPGVDFCKINKFHFQKPDMEKFPCLKLAFKAAIEAGTMPCVLNAANEEAVTAFMNGGLSFTDIPKVIEKVLSCHRKIQNPGLTDILQADNWARIQARKAMN